MTEGHTQDFTVLENNTMLLIFNNEINSQQQQGETQTWASFSGWDYYFGDMKAS